MRAIGRARLWTLVFIILAAAIAVAIPIRAEAHASLIASEPSHGDELDAVPDAVAVTFNERLESRLYFIKVFDAEGNELRTPGARMSDDRKRISVPFPGEAEGRYTVSYSVISADGHPVAGSYFFTVGRDQEAAGSGLPDDPTAGRPDAIFFLVRGVLYVSMLFAVGWVGWGAWIAANADEGVRLRYRRWLRRILLVFLAAQIAYAFVWLRDIRATTWDGALSALVGTSAGTAAVAMLGLTAIGVPLLGRWKLADAGWILLLVTAKSMAGHPWAHDPRGLAIASNGIHLLGAALWAGGLLFLVAFWRRHRDAAAAFAPAFSSAALISVLALAFSGTILTLLYVPKVSYLLDAAWGRLLVAKVCATALVAIAGGLLRRSMRRSGRERALRPLLLLDAGLMLVIAGLASAFTYLNPVPENKTLDWHDMHGTVMVAAQLVPAGEGMHAFRFDVESTDEDGAPPKRVTLLLSSLDRREVASILVPLERSGGDGAYRAEGPYPPFPGRWNVQLRILDANDDETVFEKRWTTY
ncbi:hypothetical protein FE782_13740 [Paenibacillus antri]|uniref:Copper resistance protein CopC n=1 Tax=Paenibacillus antri TaxID=2582848 RepID=A0A5R9GFU4_9BACL|nr:copper resistance protein CopC [Paenibacillus antri]TLS51563.1 hypothetical protein FE782_13740 [Paenibacillus antri]